MGNFNNAGRQNANSAPPGYNHPVSRQNVQQSQVSYSTSIEDLLKEYMAKNDAVIQRQAASLRAETTSHQHTIGRSFGPNAQLCEIHEIYLTK